MPFPFHPGGQITRSYPNHLSPWLSQPPPPGSFRHQSCPTQKAVVNNSLSCHYFYHVTLWVTSMALHFTWQQIKTFLSLPSKPYTTQVWATSLTYSPFVFPSSLLHQHHQPVTPFYFFSLMSVPSTTIPLTLGRPFQNLFFCPLPSTSAALHIKHGCLIL